MTNTAAPVAVHRQFVQVGARRVLLRCAGQGPAVVLVHQSPQNGRAMEPWIHRLATRYAVFAPDTPGYGHSDPLPLAAPGMADYASALRDLLDALGLQRVLLFGMHTGAAIATQTALCHPGRVAGLVCDGLALFDEDERAAILAGYLPPLEPSWDGGHLRWLFARLREQHLFFPWFDGTRAHRLHYPLPSAERVHEGVMDLLDAGDGYRLAYRASFVHDPVEALRALQPPARFFYRRADVLAHCAARCPVLPPQAKALVLQGEEDELVQRCDEVFAAWASQASLADSAVALRAALSPTRHVLQLGGFALAFHLTAASANGGDAAGAVTLHIPDIGRAATPPDAGAGLGIALEWPGHGASGAGALIDGRAPVTMPALAGAVDAALDQLLGTQRPMAATAPLHLQAEGGGCALAVELARQLGPRCTSLRLHNPLPLDDAERAQFLVGLPQLTHKEHGMALLAAWDWVRLSQLFWPWLPPGPTAVIEVPSPDPVRVHAQVREVLRAGPLHAALWQAALHTPLAPALQAWGGAVHIVASVDAEHPRLAQRLAQACGLQARGASSWEGTAAA